MLELDKQHHKVKLFLTVAATVTFLITLLSVIFAYLLPMLAPGVEEPPSGVREVLLLVLGSQLMVYKETYTFWLGSSAGSLRKSIVEKQGGAPEGVSK